MVSPHDRDFRDDSVIPCSIQNPAFGPAQVRKFTSLFLEKSLEVSTFGREASLSIRLNNSVASRNLGRPNFQINAERRKAGL
jgi:hypothetical protein